MRVTTRERAISPRALYSQRMKSFHRTEHCSCRVVSFHHTPLLRQSYTLHIFVNKSIISWFCSSLVQIRYHWVETERAGTSQLGINSWMVVGAEGLQFPRQIPTGIRGRHSLIDRISRAIILAVQPGQDSHSCEAFSVGHRPLSEAGVWTLLALPGHHRTAIQTTLPGASIDPRRNDAAGSRNLPRFRLFHWILMKHFHSISVACPSWRQSIAWGR